MFAYTPSGRGPDFRTRKSRAWRSRELANVWSQIPGVIARCIRNAFHGRLSSANPQRASRFAETVTSSLSYPFEKPRAPSNVTRPARHEGNTFLLGSVDLL